MTFSDFTSSVLGTHLGETNLIHRYANDVYAINSPLVEPLDYWNNPPAEILNGFHRVQGNDPHLGDIVVVYGFSGTTVGIANKDADEKNIEVLEQDGIVRLVIYDKDRVTGILRPLVKPVVEEPVEEVEETPKVHTFAKGALHVPLNRVEYRIDTELNGYRYLSHAQAGEKAVERLKPGTYYMTSQQDGMAKVDKGDDTESYWINPLDNLPPSYMRPTQVEYKPDGEKEARDNYVDFLDSRGDWAEKYLTAKDGGAYQIHFASGKSMRMPAGKHVFVAGYTVVDDSKYAVATKCFIDDDGNDRPQPIWIGIRYSELYDDGTYSTTTTVEERQVLRTLKPNDYLTLFKAKAQKRFMDVRKVK